MKIAVISDIHANLAALRTVIDFLHAESITAIACLGDVVGYGPFPNECVDLVRRHCLLTVAGNHDYAALERLDATAFNRYAREAIQWTRLELNQDSRRFLAALPLIVSQDQICYVHSSPREPHDWNYVFSGSTARECFHYFEERLCFIGHSHIPVVFSQQQGATLGTKVPLSLREDRYIINVGSVGQPRDGDPRACLAVYDPEQALLTYHRLNYPIKETQAEMRRKKMPEFLISRLEIGR